METMNKKKRFQWSDMIFRFRHSLAFVTILLAVLVFGIDSYAYYNAYTATYDESINFLTYYDAQIENGSYAYLQSSEVSDYLDSLGIDVTASNINANSRFGASFSPDQSTVLGSYTVFPITCQNNMVDYSAPVSSARYWSYQSVSGYHYYSSMVCDGDGEFALINLSGHLYVVSDQEFYVWGISFGSSDWSPQAIFEQTHCWLNNESGLYMYPIDDNYDTEQVYFTNMPVYVNSEDGSTGFTGMSDFSLSGSNINCNYPFINGWYVDPDNPIPSPEPTPQISPEGQHFTYAGLNVEFVGLSNNLGFTANYEFALNAYMKQHPEDYTVITDYQLQVIYGNNTYLFVLEDYIDGDALVYNTGKVTKSIGFSQMRDESNDVSLTSFLKNVWTTATNSQNDNFYTDGSVISYNVHQASGSRSFGGFHYGVLESFEPFFTKFYLSTNTYIRFNGSPTQESGNLRAFYNFLSGDSNILENNIGTNYNPPTTGSTDLTNYNPYVSTPTSATGTMNKAEAYIQSGAIQIITGQQGGFQLSTQGWTDYGNYVMTTGQALSEVAQGTGTFGTVVKDVLGVLPAPIWTLLLAGVGTSVCLGIWHQVRSH